MRTLMLAALQLHYEQRVYWRNLGGAFFTFAFPVLLFVLMATLFHDTPNPEIGGRPLIEYYTPVLAMYGVMSACFVSPAITVTYRRELGLLKQLRVTPLPLLSYFGGLAISAAINAAIIVVLVLALGIGVYDASWPEHWLWLVISFILGALSFCALGLAISSLVNNADSAPAVLNLVFLALLVISGGFFPIDAHSTLGTIAKVFPLWHLLQPAVGSFATNADTPWWHLVVVLAWGVAALLFALRSFRWNPRK